MRDLTPSMVARPLLRKSRHTQPGIVLVLIMTIVNMIMVDTGVCKINTHSKNTSYGSQTTFPQISMLTK